MQPAGAISIQLYMYLALGGKPQGLRVLQLDGQGLQLKDGCFLTLEAQQLVLS